MVREPSKAPADNGWRIFSAIDDDEYLVVDPVRDWGERTPRPAGR